MTDTGLIYLFGKDALLLQTRAAILRFDGHRVQVFACWLDARHLCAPRLVLICHTLSPDERTALIAALLTTWPLTSRLCLVREAGEPVSGAITIQRHTSASQLRIEVDRQMSAII